MTRLPFFQVDAFASRPFEGNPAPVIPLDAWLPDDVMLAIAAENNLSETAFTANFDQTHSTLLDDVAPDGSPPCVRHAWQAPSVG